MNLPEVTSDVIRKLVSEGESASVEFKRQELPNSVLASVIAGFANAEGGILLIGVEDNGEIAGVADAREVAAKVRGIGFNLLGDPISAGIRDVDGHDVVYAVVPVAPEHLRPVVTSAGQAFVRTGTETRRTERKPPKTSRGRHVKVFVAMSFRDEEEPSLVDYFLCYGAGGGTYEALNEAK